MTQILATAAANTVNENSKTLLVSAYLRSLIVKGKYFRKSRQEKLEIMETVMEDLAIIYEGHSVPATSIEVLKNLTAFKNTAWAETIFSFVSPSMYVKLLTKRMEDFSEEFQTRCFNEIVEQWKNRVRDYVGSHDVDNGALIAIGETVTGNVALSTAFNEVVPGGFQVVVFDEDAVQTTQATTLPEPPAEIIVDIASLPVNTVDDDPDA